MAGKSKGQGGDGAGKSHDFMLEDEYFIRKNVNQKKKTGGNMIHKPLKKPAMNYSGKIEMSYKKSK